MIDPYRIFLSHGNEDKYVVEKLFVAELRQLNLELFIDFGSIEIGDEFRVKIIEELRRCHELIVLLTPTSIKRPWIHAEIGAVITKENVRVSAFRFGVAPDELQELGITSIIGHNTIEPLAKLDDYFIQLSKRIEGRSNE